MANHKRKRTANQRAGCKYCKPWKGNGVSIRRASDERKLQVPLIDELVEYAYYNHPYYYDIDYEDDWWDDQGLLEFLKEYNVK